MAFLRDLSITTIYTLLLLLMFFVLFKPDEDSQDGEESGGRFIGSMLVSMLLTLAMSGGYSYMTRY